MDNYGRIALDTPRGLWHLGRWEPSAGLSGPLMGMPYVVCEAIKKPPTYGTVQTPNILVRFLLGFSLGCCGRGCHVKPRENKYIYIGPTGIYIVATTKTGGKKDPDGGNRPRASIRGGAVFLPLNIAYRFHRLYDTLRYG